ncbi:MAG: MBL fold metallo-hydrolase [Desulfobacteraceae bacterium]|jgi:glyoxylase-like metal-dependent hydrolase (beta-lactamase superfamily II)
MEIRLNAGSGNSLSTKVFFSDEKGFEVASVIVMGKKDAVLLDAQWTLSNAHRIITEILETGKNLTAIYISHAHPDHYFGVGIIAEAFPDARVVAISSEAEIINEQFFGKMEVWEEQIGAHNVCRKEANVESLKENCIELEGHRLEIISKVMGDMKYNTMVRIPSIKTLYASDVLFNQAHAFTCELTEDERKQWIADIDKIEKMGAEIIIPGHQKPGMPFDKSSLDFTREYIVATEEELARTESVGDFYYAMDRRFPEANLGGLSNEMNANVFKGGRDWHWRDM